MPDPVIVDPVAVMTQAVQSSVAVVVEDGVAPGAVALIPVIARATPGATCNPDGDVMTGLLANVGACADTQEAQDSPVNTLHNHNQSTSEPPVRGTLLRYQGSHVC